MWSRFYTPVSTNGHSRLPINTRAISKQEEYGELLLNTLISRAELFNRLTDPRRDINAECGYPEFVSPQMYQAMYDWEPYAARVVELFPKECWKKPPTIYEDEDSDAMTPFEEAWDQLGSQLRSERSYHKEEKGSLVWDYLFRADVISRVGRYGCILIGLEGDKDLEKPATKKEGQKIAYLRVFSEVNAQVTQWEDDPSSPRNGMPVMYLLTFNSPDNRQGGGVGLTTNSRNVHWSRVVHIPSDGALSGSEWAGVPSMQQVYRPLLDCTKIRASSGEGFWRAVVAIISLETHPQLGGDVKINRDQIKNMMEQVFGGTKREMVLNGMSAKTISPTVVDPNPHMQANVEAICTRIGVPIPVFKGFEIGEQASTENKGQWGERVLARCTGEVTPRVVVPFTDRVISLGCLPEPEQYLVGWVEEDSESKLEQSTILVARTTALTTFVSGGGPEAMSLKDFYVREMKYDEEEADAIIEAMEEEKATRDAEAEAQGFEKAPPPGMVDPAAVAQEQQVALEAAKAGGKAKPPSKGGPPVPGKPGAKPPGGPAAKGKPPFAKK